MTSNVMLPAMSINHDPGRAQVGIVGGGQLARMMCQSAISLGITVRVMANHRDDSTALIWPNVLVGDPDDPASLAEFCRSCEVVTFDHELVSLPALRQASAEAVIFRPSLAVLRIAQNKRLQRERFAAIGLPAPRFTIAETVEDAALFGAQVGWPCIIKSAVGGYDGRGVWVVKNLDEAEVIVSALLANGIEPLLEEHVTIVAEYAQQVARGADGDKRFYPLVETVQRNAILREAWIPAPVDAAIATQAREIASAIADHLQVVGMLAVELLYDGERLLINEIAARPHNSGHYSIEGCVTSQFEQHLRAVCGLPLGQTEMVSPLAVAVNVIGDHSSVNLVACLARASEVAGAHLHWYGKEHRPGRKLGHVTVLGSNMNEARQRAWTAAIQMGGAPCEEVVHD